MRSLAAYVVKGRLQAVLVAAVSALLGLMLLPISYLSGATVALVTLRMGLQEGLLLVVTTLLVVWGVGQPIIQPASYNLVFVATLLPSVWVMAASLRRTARPARSLILAAVVCMMAVLTFHIGTDSTVDWWYGRLEEGFSALLAQLAEAERAQLLQNLRIVASLMTGMTAAVLCASLIGSLLLGRWWQAVLYNPGGFGEEFRRIRLGRSLTLIVMALIVANTFMEAGPVYQDLLPVLMVPFAVQGLAVIHALIKQRNVNAGWLTGLYVLLFVATGQMVLLLAIVGAVDNWFDFRGFVGPNSGAGDK